MKIFFILLISGVLQIFGHELSNSEIHYDDNGNGVNMINLLFTKLNVILEDNYKTYTNLMETNIRFNEKNLTMDALIEETVRTQSAHFNFKMQIFSEICQIKMELIQVLQKQKEEFALQRLKDQHEFFKKLQITNGEYILEPEKFNNESLESLILEIKKINDRFNNQMLQNANISMDLQNIDKRLKDQTISMEIIQNQTNNITIDLPNKSVDLIEHLKTISENVTSIQKSLIKVVNQQKDWVVVQRRLDGSVDFYRSWTEYKNGFGSPEGEFFIGLEKLYALSKGGVELLIIMEDFNRQIRYAKYSKFEIGNETEKYVLKQWDGYSGNAGDSLRIHRNEKFSTRDQDNDSNSSKNCAENLKGAWWFYDCPNTHTDRSSLNGVYKLGNNSSTGGITWDKWLGSNYSLKYVEMMVR